MFLIFSFSYFLAILLGHFFFGCLLPSYNVFEWNQASVLRFQRVKSKLMRLVSLLDGVSPLRSPLDRHGTKLMTQVSVAGGCKHLDPGSMTQHWDAPAVGKFKWSLVWGVISDINHL